MAKVSISINGRNYAMGCDDGEEARLTAMGQKLDRRVRALADQFGQIGDLRLMVMAGITLVDELTELEEDVEQRAESLATDVRRASEEAINLAQASESLAVSEMMDVAKRIDSLTRKIAAAEASGQA